MTNIQSHQTSGPVDGRRSGRRSARSPACRAAIESLRLTLENQRNVMVERLAAIPGVHVTKPNGTFYCFPDFSAYMKDSQKLAELLLERVRVVTVPGKEFGMEGHLRLSYCGTIKEIMDGLERIKWALDPKAPNELYPRRPQAGEGLGMNLYIDVSSPAVGQAGALREPLRAREPRPHQPAPRLLEPAGRGALRRGGPPLGGPALPTTGAFVVDTGKHTARAAADKFVVREPHDRGARLVGPVQPALQPGELQRAPRAPVRLPAGARRVRAGRLRRGRPRPPPARSGSSPRRPGTACSRARCS